MVFSLSVSVVGDAGVDLGGSGVLLKNLGSFS